MTVRIRLVSSDGTQRDVQYTFDRERGRTGVLVFDLETLKPKDGLRLTRATTQAVAEFMDDVAAPYFDGPAVPAQQALASATQEGETHDG